MSGSRSRCAMRPADSSAGDSMSRAAKCTHPGAPMPPRAPAHRPEAASLVIAAWRAVAGRARARGGAPGRGSLPRVTQARQGGERLAPGRGRGPARGRHAGGKGPVRGAGRGGGGGGAQRRGGRGGRRGRGGGSRAPVRAAPHSECALLPPGNLCCAWTTGSGTHHTTVRRSLGSCIVFSLVWLTRGSTSLSLSLSLSLGPSTESLH